jgi:5'-nucleotidase
MRARTLLAVACVAAVAACGGGDDGASDATTTTPSTDSDPTTTTAAPTTTAAVEPLTILVSNDDGVLAEGLDHLVQALAADPTVELVVVAPADEQSGSGDATTPGGAPAEPSATASGFAAIAVAGEPADAVLHGLDVVLADDPPDLVVAGINAGQNLGPLADFSGTVGAARTAARRGFPAVAVSQGVTCEGCAYDFESGAEAFLEWFAANRGSLAAGTVVNINVPTCAAGTQIRGTVEVPSSTEAVGASSLAVADCASTVTDPADDVAAFNAGFVAVSDPGLD